MTEELNRRQPPVALPEGWENVPPEEIPASFADIRARHPMLEGEDEKAYARRLCEKLDEEARIRFAGLFNEKAAPGQEAEGKFRPVRKAWMVEKVAVRAREEVYRNLAVLDDDEMYMGRHQNGDRGIGLLPSHWDWPRHEGNPVFMVLPYLMRLTLFVPELVAMLGNMVIRAHRNEEDLMHAIHSFGKDGFGPSRMRYVLSLNDANPNGWGLENPLHHFMKMNDSYDQNREAVALLLEYGADPNVQDEEGYTPLFRAVERKNLKFARMLLETPGIDLELPRNSDGKTVLDIPEFRKRIEQCRPKSRPPVPACRP